MYEYKDDTLLLAGNVTYVYKDDTLLLTGSRSQWYRLTTNSIASTAPIAIVA